MNEKKRILCVIDMQNDFIDGVLGSAEAKAIVPHVVEKIKEYKDRGDLILTTQDTHYSDYLETLEGKKLPIPHCIANSDGWQLNTEVYNELREYQNKENFTKITFGSDKLQNYLRGIINKENETEYEIELIGLDLDICVISNAIILRMYFPNTVIHVDSRCTAATSGKTFESAISVLKSCQVNVYG